MSVKDEVIKFVKENSLYYDCGIFNCCAECDNWAKKWQEFRYDDGSLYCVVGLCDGYAYIEVIGVSHEDYVEIENAYYATIADEDADAYYAAIGDDVDDDDDDDDN